LAHGYIILPLASRGKTVGALCFYTPPGFRLDLAREEFLVSVSRQISVAVESARLAAEQRAQMQNMAILEERERISREMHDGLAQVLGFLCVKAESALSLLKSGQAQEATAALREIENVAQEAYVEVREAILGLRTTVAPGTGLIPSLTEYIHRFGRQFGVDVRLVLPDGADIRLAPSAEVQLLRIVQEALTNVRKHAKARHAWVRFKVTDGTAVVVIEDDGCGFDLAQVQGKHFGLEAMRERAEAVGGSFELETAPGYGTRLTVRLPLGSGVIGSGGAHVADFGASS
jgi:signal transduction histidine kinase